MQPCAEPKEKIVTQPVAPGQLAAHQARDCNGVPHVTAGDEAALFFGQGMAHAKDRALQMLLMRILGQGRLAETLDSRDASVQLDRFFRRANWSGNTQAPLEQLNPNERALLEAYCLGVNEVLSKRVPWEFKLC